MNEMTPRIDLRPDHLEIVCAILREHVPERGVLAFGSRATWTAKEYSDLDLAVLGNEPLTLDITSALTEEFSESDLPFKVDIVEWARVDENFRDKLRRNGVVVQTSVWRSNLRKGPYGPIAKHYRETTLKNLCVPGNGIQTGPFGSQLHQRDYVDDGAPIITVEHLNENRIVHRNLPRVSYKDKKRLSKYCLRLGDIVFSRVGSVDRRALVRTTEEGWLFSGRCLRVRPNPEYIDSIWLSYFFGLAGFRHYIRSIAVGATMPSLNTQLLSDVVVPYPPLTEQRAIAHILSTLDEKIELNRRMNKTLEEMAQALFKSWFVDFDPVRAKMEGRDTGLPKHIDDLFSDRLVNSKFGEVPMGWGVKTLKQSFNLTMGQSPPSSTYNHDAEGMPFFQGKTDFGFRYPQIRKFSTAPTRLAQSGDTLISVRAPVGDINLALTECSIGRGLSALRHKSNSISYTYYFAKSIQKQIASYEDNGTVFGSINRKQFENLCVLEPSKKLVKKFDEIISPIDKTVRINFIEVGELTQLRETLLPKLISGELTVN